MEQTWRWFGEADPIPLDHIRQAGATGIVTALHHIPAGEVWTPQEIARRNKRSKRAAFAGASANPSPSPTRSSSAARARGNRSTRGRISLANLGRAGIPVVCYNFMPVVDWTRTDLAYKLPPGGLALRFDMIDFIGYDAFVLKRARRGRRLRARAGRGGARRESPQKAKTKSSGWSATSSPDFPAARTRRRAHR